jgi:hypothetical protein
VEAAADALVVEDAVDARARVVTALSDLAAGLLVHLTYEEEAIGPTILEWDGWPLQG